MVVLVAVRDRKHESQSPHAITETPQICGDAQVVHLETAELPGHILDALFLILGNDLDAFGIPACM